MKYSYNGSWRASFLRIAPFPLVFAGLYFFWALYVHLDTTRYDPSQRNTNIHSPTAPKDLSALKLKEFPRKHWQTWKTSITNIEDEMLIGAIKSWRELNPDIRYETLSDMAQETYVRNAYAKRPNVVETFLAIQDPIVRADFVRYLILLADGGVYSDVDTKALKPISKWLTPKQQEEVGFVLGVEIDEPGVMWADWADNFVFCQSTMMSKPGHPILEILVWNILRTITEKADEQNTSISKIKFSFQDVLRISGPKAFSDAVFTYLTTASGTNVDRGNFTGLTSPRQVGDVLVLPVNAFVPGQPHSNSGAVTDATALVQHLGMGSWRGDHKFDSQVKEEEEEEKKAEEERKAKDEEKQRQAIANEQNGQA
ncbi:hypothetical protein B7494_g5470 [Chlorociboria aeruginascens]|nr:hypothetical protein B7494_g5470 [Chlorociboria aeruginascens]